MTVMRHLLAPVLLLALAACASAPGPAAVADPGVPVAGTTAPVEPAAADGAGNEAAAAMAEGLAADDRTVASTPVAAPDGPVTAAEDDYAALYGEDPNGTAPAPAGEAEAPATRPTYDPWEPVNRKIHAFNNAIDRTVARPLALAYVAVVPQPMRLGVTNFFDNLGAPLTFVNQLLQGRPRHAVQTLGRFVVNSTLGIGGIFDPASDLKMKRRSEDFGQTLGMWGWRSSRYVELPFFGPRTLRDTFGLAGDMPLSVTRQVEEDKIRITLQGLQLVDTRSQLLALDAMRRDASDDYALVRDAWLARRTFQIEGDRRRRADAELPEYLQEEEEQYPNVPANAMPLPLPGG